MVGKTSRRFNFLWLIPILVLGYIGWMNVLPLGASETYFIDVGGKDTSGNALLTGPFDRISDNKDMDSISFRNLEKNLVYFELGSRMLKDASEVSAKVRFKDNFPEDGKFILGARDKEDSIYYWKEIYAPFYGQLANLPLVAENANIKVYATSNTSSTKFANVDDFLKDPPLGSVIATNDRGLNINQGISQEESGGIDVSEFAARDISPIPIASDVDRNGYLETDISLRGPHTFYFFSDGGTLELSIAKRDLNWYQGEDTLDVTIYSLDGTLKAMTTIADDGDNTPSKNLGPSQYQTLKVENLERGVYRLVLTPESEGSDFVVTHLALNQSKLVIPGTVFLAGNSYLGEETEPITVWCYLFSDGEIKLSTLHDSALQNITISGEGYDQTISLDTVNTRFGTGLLKAGIYEITSEKGDITAEASNGYFAFTKDSLFLPTSSSNRGEKEALLINTTLRGRHTLWTYVKNNSLELNITKQDLNWYEGPDELKVEVYSLNGELKGSASIPDDGDEGEGKKIGPLQSSVLKIDGLQPGTYRIELEGGGDLLIRQIEINQSKLVVDEKVFLAGTNSAYFKGGLAFDPVRLYTKNFTTAQIKFHTWHNYGLQQIIIQGDSFDTEADVNEVNSEFDVSLEAGTYQLTVPRQDVIIESKGYFSFTPDSFFLPQRCKVVDLKYDLSWAKENVDYIVVNSKDYLPPVEDDGWLIAQATWKREDLFVDNDKLSFCFNVPHLVQSEEAERAIPIDWIEINLKILPLPERLTWIGQFLDRADALIKKLPIG